MSQRRLKRWMQPLRRSPLHPQWLLGGRAVTGHWLKSHARGDVLDIGCADRWAASALLPGCRYLGLDSIRTGQDWYGARPEILGDASRLPFSDRSFDTVLLLDVAEHLTHPAEAISGIARVLRPGGVVLLSMPFLYPIHDAPHDYQRYTAHGLEREMRAVGLHTETLQPSLGTAETAGLLMCLSLAGMSAEALRKRHLSILLLPLMVLLIPAINLLAWLAGKLLPSWDAFSAGYRLVARKP